MSSRAPVELFTALVDDAAVFPPRRAAMPDAVREHRVHRRAWYHHLIGPLLVPVRGLDAFAASAVRQPDGAQPDGVQADPLRVTLIGDPTRSDPVSDLLDAAAAIPELGGGQRVELVAVELAMPSQEAQGAQARSVARLLDRSLPDGVVAWLEVRADPDLPDALAALAQGPQRVRAKFRTGGTAPHMFPSPPDLAVVLHHACQVGVRLKLTAGLHHAIRHTDSRTGFVHHGFVNVLAAVAAAQHGTSVETMARLLSSEDSEALGGQLAALDDASARAVRSTFAAFGCCGVTDPVDDLVVLGLLTATGAEPAEDEEIA